MKLHFTLKLCGVLIGITSCLIISAAAEENTVSGSDANPGFSDGCIGPYLKSKGKLEDSVSSGNPSYFCQIAMRHYLRLIREVFESKVENELPNESVCVMAEFDENQIADNIVHMGFLNNSLPRSLKEPIEATIHKERNGLLKTIATKCGIEEGKMNAFIGADSSQDEIESISETTLTLDSEKPNEIV